MSKYRYNGQDVTYQHLPLERDADGTPTRVAPYSVTDGDVVELDCDPPDDSHWSAADDHTGPLLRPDNEDADGASEPAAPKRARPKSPKPTPPAPQDPPQDPPSDPPLDPENTP